MSDEPIYCTTCGTEIGDGCACANNDWGVGSFCHFCGAEGANEGECAACRALDAIEQAEGQA